MTLSYNFCEYPSYKCVEFSPSVHIFITVTPQDEERKCYNIHYNHCDLVVTLVTTHFLAKCYCQCLVALVMSDSLRPYGPQDAGLLCPRDYPGKNTGVGCHILLHEIFLTQALNPHFLPLLHWQVGTLPLVPASSHKVTIFHSPASIE